MPEGPLTHWACAKLKRDRIRRKTGMIFDILLRACFLSEVFGGAVMRKIGGYCSFLPGISSKFEFRYTENSFWFTAIHGWLLNDMGCQLGDEDCASRLDCGSDICICRTSRSKAPKANGLINHSPEELFCRNSAPPSRNTEHQCACVFQQPRQFRRRRSCDCARATRKYQAMANSLRGMTADYGVLLFTQSGRAALQFQPSKST